MTLNWGEHEDEQAEIQRRDDIEFYQRHKSPQNPFMQGDILMGKLSDLLPQVGSYLKATDVPDGATMRLIIEKIEHEKMPSRDGEQGEEQKPVVYFLGKEKGLVLNRTNLDTLISLFEDDVAAITGKEIILFRTVANFAGKSVAALRIRGVDTAEECETVF